MMVDGTTVITDSFNFTKAEEENNEENLLIIHNAGFLADKYAANWLAHQQHSEP